MFRLFKNVILINKLLNEGSNVDFDLVEKKINKVTH